MSTVLEAFACELDKISAKKQKDYNKALVVGAGVGGGVGALVGAAPGAVATAAMATHPYVDFRAAMKKLGPSIARSTAATAAVGVPIGLAAAAFRNRNKKK